MSLEATIQEMDQYTLVRASDRAPEMDTPIGNALVSGYSLFKAIRHTIYTVPDIFPRGVDGDVAEPTFLLIAGSLITAARDQQEATDLFVESTGMTPRADSMQRELEAITPADAAIAVDRVLHGPWWNDSDMAHVEEFPSIVELIMQGSVGAQMDYGLSESFDFINASLAVWQLVIEASREHENPFEQLGHDL